MVALYLVTAGETLYETKTVKQGNTTLSERIAYRVKVIEVHRDHIIASWNSNAPQKMGAHRVSRMTRSPPKGTAERRRYDAEQARVLAEIEAKEGAGA